MSDQCTIGICDYTEAEYIPSEVDLTLLFLTVLPIAPLSQFHYIIPSIRRVFIEPNPSESNQELKQKFDASEVPNAVREEENPELQKSFKDIKSDLLRMREQRDPLGAKWKGSSSSSLRWKRKGRRSSDVDEEEYYLVRFVPSHAIKRGFLTYGSFFGFRGKYLGTASACFPTCITSWCTQTAAAPLPTNPNVRK
ncbi:hypothetical protein ARMSODRAFT_1004456 [Armillaria solidipes]|uniref:Uncharacterized protein n=1 Tax=Armillaria solidipes TaxID=1076256 RepID=A0A2H3BE90_9AGAR|nr:hypothetical protein ARMSODRAFT_1004456 [Armillaria solidipes]